MESGTKKKAAAKPETTPEVAATPTAPAEPAAAAPVVGGKKSKKGLIIGIVIAVIIIAAGVAYGVYAYMSSSPDNLMKTAVDNLSKEKSLATTFKIEQGSSTISGDLAYTTDPANSKNGELIAGMDISGTRIGVSAMALNDALYVKAIGMQALTGLLVASSGTTDEALIAQYATMLESINDQWISISKEEMQSLTSSANAGVNGVPTDAEIKKVLELYNAHTFVKADKTFADETIDNTNTTHFNLKIDKAQLVAFAEALKAANLPNITVSSENITQIKNADASTTTTVDVWIAKDSKKFKQIRLADTKPGEESTITITFKSALPSFDKFEKPASAKSVNELLTEMMSGFEVQADVMIQ